METWPNNQAPILGTAFASQAVADCKVSASSALFQREGPFALAPGGDAVCVEIVSVLVVVMELVPGMVLG